MKKINVALVFATAILGLTSCKNEPKFKTIEGLEYMIAKDAPGDKKPKEGDIIEFHLRMSIDDSLLADTKKERNGEPVQGEFVKPQTKGDLWTGMALLTPGDSAVFLVSVDSMIAQQKRMQPNAEIPAWVQGKKKFKYEVVLVSVKSKDEMKKDMEAKASEQGATDDKLLQDYFAKNGITATKTASGLYYTIQTEGTGETIKAGQTAEMRYIGALLDGKVFDANMGAEGKGPDGKEKPVLPVEVGKGMVIRGWDEGLQLLKKGSKATFYIPSTLAYGPEARGEALPANSVLIFNVEVVSVK